MTHNEYSGWHNFETWVTKLWLDNEQSSQEYWAEQAQAHIKRHRMENSHLLADALKESHEEQLPELSGFAADLMNSAFSEINWEEIAESLLNDAKEEMERAK